MSLLSDLYRQYNNLVSSITGQNNKITKLKRRRSEVETIQRNLNSVANGNSSDVNSKIRTAAQKLETGIEYSSKEYKLDQILSGKNEGGISSDTNLANAYNELQKEINDINRQISEAEAEKNSANNKANNVKSQIRAEEKRIKDAANG